ncbi:MAG: hypothetical protein K0S47_4285, partial [Herbinix sp.]|nr:hypothetical protein [Herbinix sp.]
MKIVEKYIKMTYSVSTDSTKLLVDNTYMGGKMKKKNQRQNYFISKRKKSLLIILMLSLVIGSINFNYSIAIASTSVVSRFSAEVTNSQFYTRPWTPGDHTYTDFDWSATWFTPDILIANDNSHPASTGNFNYITVNLTPAVSGNYTVKIDSATGLLTGVKSDTQIWIYENSFNPISPLTNVVAVNEDIDYFGPSGNESDGNWLSQIVNIPLTQGTTYVLVITTYTAGVTGSVDFSITGPGTVTASGDTLEPTTPAAPNVSADDTNNIILGADATMEYSSDNGASWTSYDPGNEPTFAGNRTVIVRVKASGNNPAGDVTTIGFTTNPVTPAAPNVSADDTYNTILGA